MTSSLHRKYFNPGQLLGGTLTEFEVFECFLLLTLSLCQLYEDERRTATQLQAQLADVRREMSDLRQELDRLRQSSSSINDRRVTYELVLCRAILNLFLD